jgi:Right handed beta helix region
MTFEPKLQFHVAPAGDDSSPGTVGLPFASLGRAQEAVRASTPGMRKHIVVNLHDGTHVLAEPLVLSGSAGDSGQNGFQVIYQAYGWGTPAQAAVVLSGGRRIGDWQQDDEGQGVWRAEVGDLDTRQLYVDGRRARRCRLELGPFGGLPGNVMETDEGYITDSTEPQSWENPRDIELVYRGHAGFAEPRCGIAAISGDERSTTIAMDQPGYRWFRQNHRGRWGDGPRGFGQTIEFAPPPPLWAENSKSFLTEPGTFYLDRSRPGAHVLFYIPRPGEDLATAEVIAPSLETLVEGHGKPGAPLHDVVFRGLTFSHATWLGPGEPTGFSQVFGPIYEGGDTPDFDDPWDSSASARSMPGNVRFQHAERIVLEDNRFKRLGSDALELSMGCSENRVRGNVFEDVSGGGIQLGSRQPDTDLDRVNRDNAVENNLVRHVGVEYQGSIGIYAEKTQGTRIAHNEVHDTPYTGIAFGEYWTHYPDGETTARGNRIENNRIFRTMLALRDGGGIFTASHQGTSFEDGTVVSGNVVHDIATSPDPGAASSNGLRPEDIGEDSAIGLYADDDANFIVWRENVVYRVAGTAISGCPLHNVFTRNFLEDTEEPEFWCTRGALHVDFDHNTVLRGDGDLDEQIAAAPACAAIVARSGLEAPYRRLRSEDTLRREMA